MPVVGVFLGMGGDEHLLDPLLPEGWQALYPEWPIPEKDESLELYCSRPEFSSMENCDALLGLSFGGIMAVAYQRAAKNEIPLLLMSCGLHRRELHPLLRIPLIPPLLRVLSPERLKSWMLRGAGLAGREGLALRKYIKKVNARTYHWALRQSVTARLETPTEALRLHGARDPIFPQKQHLNADILPKAGHLLWRDHPEEVRSWLTKSVHSFSGAQPL